MGFTDIFKGKKTGWECKRDPNSGAETCMKFELDNDGNKLATGTQITFETDNNCNVNLGGDTNSILAEDSKEVQELIGRKASNCRKGIV